MTQRNFALAALAALALAACQRPAEDSNIAIDNVINAAEAAQADVALPPSASDGAALGSPTAPLANEATPLPTSIPVQFHGRWGINRLDCTSTRGDAKGLMTIAATRLTFYESSGSLGAVMGATPNSFDAKYAFTGEGQTWERVERFKLVDNRLQRRTNAAPGQEPPVNLTYERCGSSGGRHEASD